MKRPCTCYYGIYDSTKNASYFCSNVTDVSTFWDRDGAVSGGVTIAISILISAIALIIYLICGR